MWYKVGGHWYAPDVVVSMLIFTQNWSKRLYFGRDPLGRRSLLIHKPTTTFPVFILSSVSAQMPEGLTFEELSSDHLFSLDLNILCGLDDVCRASFSGGFLVVDISKASHGL